MVEPVQNPDSYDSELDAMITEEGLKILAERAEAGDEQACKALFDACTKLEAALEECRRQEQEGSNA